MYGCIYRTEDNRCEFWSDYGKGIVSYCDYEDYEDKHPSNADRIRSMTDAELAKLISSDWCDIACTPETQNCNMDCIDKILDWLRREVKDLTGKKN